MQVMNAAKFRRNMHQAMEQAMRYGEPLCIAGKAGNAVLMSEEEYNDLMATLELCAVPGMREKIERGLHTPLEECLPENEVTW